MCLDVLSADGVADEAELKNLEDLTEKIGLSFNEVQKMKDKALVKIDTKSAEGGESASDESLLGMKTDLSNKEALTFIKKNIVNGTEDLIASMLEMKEIMLSVC